MTPQELAAIIERLDESIARDPSLGPELFAQLVAAQRRLGLLHGDRPLCPFLRPHILARAQYEAVASAAATLAGAFERMAEAALGNDRLLAELGLTEREARMARLDPGYAPLCVSSRLDAFLTEEGFQFLEYNAETPAGVADQMQLEKVLFALPPLKEFLEQHPHWTPRPHRRLLDALLETYREWGGAAERPQIAIVDWRGVSTASEFRILEDFFIAEGYATIIADPRELSFDGEVLRAGDFRIDILYKRVVIHEFLREYDETHPLARAYREGRVMMANSFRTKIAHKKAGFAILSDPRYAHLFTPEQIACARRHIPWTRLARRGNVNFENDERELLELLRRERARFVLKPNDDYGGAGVYLGWEMSAAEWEDALAHALKESYVAQLRAPARTVRIPAFSADRLETAEMFVDFNPFLFRNEVEGGLVRLSASALLNISSGGGETALLVIE